MVKENSSISKYKCGMTHLNYFLNILGKTFKLQKEFLKTQMTHDEVYSDTWKDKKSKWLDYVIMLRMMFYELFFLMRGIVKQWKNLTDFH